MDTWIYINGNKIHSTAIIGDNVVLGKNNIIGAYCVLGEFGFIRNVENAKKGTLYIGDNNWIGSYVSIQVSENDSIIGNNNMFMNYVNIGHDSHIGSDNEIGVHSSILGYVTIGFRNKIKARVSVRNRMVIGDDNLIGMCSNLVESIGNKKVFYGNPAELIKDL